MRLLIVAASLATSLSLKAVTSMSTSGGAVSHHGQPKRPASNCKNITFTVSATAQNQVAANPPPNFLDPDTSLAFLGQPVVLTTVSGTQNLYGQYCEPTVKNPSRAKTLQLLVHGITYDHTYWAGFDSIPSSPAYSWVTYANAQGYPTLAIDRLGNGRSDHPDPISLVQAPYQVELIHGIITQLRSSSNLAIPTPWRKVIFAGHSYGSILATQLSSRHPKDIDSYILSGFAVPLPNELSLRGVTGENYIQASAYDSARFSPAVYAPGYLVSSSKQGRQASFYSRPDVDFSRAHYDVDFQTQGTIALGEALTTVTIFNSTTYAGPVYVLTGQNDALFCGNGSRLLGTPDCGSGATSQLAALKVFYPAVPASKFDYYAQPSSGHTLQQHYTAASGFAKAHAFLAAQGF